MPEKPTLSPLRGADLFACAAAAEYTLFDGSRHLESLRRLAGPAAADQKREVVDALLLDALKHVGARCGRTLTLDDVVVFGFATDVPGFAPHLHWDTDWLMFPGCAGFQLWYLLHNEEEEGNLFLGKCPHVRADDPPLCFQFFPDGRVEKQLEDVEVSAPARERCHIVGDFVRPRRRK